MASAQKTVQISVELDQCRAHLFNVTMILHDAVANQRLSLPTWTPGSYMIREFAQHIVSLTALESEKPILVEKINKNTFQLNNHGPFVTLNYKVYGFDSSIRAAFIDDTQAFFNGTALFLRPHGFDDARFILRVIRPVDDKMKGFAIATGMPAKDCDQSGFGSYEAQSYDELVDYPFQISAMKRLSFRVKNIPHEMVLVGDVRDFDEKRLVHDLSRLCEYQINMFESAPFTSYLFIARFEEGGHGGLEHRNSTMLLATPYALPKKNHKEPDAHYRNFLSLCSHEYFHAWNVKNIKPHNFVNYDFDQECYTEMLWFFEGITSYYDDFLVRKAQLMNVSSYLDLIAKNYSKLLRNKGRHTQSLREASFDAWIKFYRQNENSQNATVSYYLKGSFLGLYLDLLLRRESKGEKTLDDVMRSLFKRYGNQKGVKEAEIFDLISEISQIDISSFRKKYLDGTDEFSFKELLEDFGVELSLHADELFLDDKTKMSAYLGIKLRFDENDRGVISLVEYDGPGMHGGLSPGDEVIAINDTRLDPANASDLFASLRVDEPVAITLARKKHVKILTIIPSKLPWQICKLSIKAKLDEKQKKNLTNWLGPIDF